MAKEAPDELEEVISSSKSGDQSRLKSENKRLRKIIEHQSEALKERAKVELPPKKSKSKGSYLRVVIPDTHGAHIDPEAAGAFLGDLAELKPKEVVLLGDHIDAGGFLAQHHVMGYVAETSYSFRDDVEAANHFLDSVVSASGAEQYHYLEGNHDLRLHKWCVTQTLRHNIDAEYLAQLFAPEKILHLGKRKVNFYSMSDFHMGLRIRGTIKLGQCHFTHGSNTSKHAASKMVDVFGGNVVFGHIHRAQSHIRRTVHSGAIGAWCPGCLCKIQPYWMHTSLTDWSHGYGLQVVQTDGTFLHINVPIVDGVSLLQPLISRLGG